MANGRLKSIYSPRQQRYAGTYETPLADFLDSLPDTLLRFEEQKLARERYEDQKNFERTKYAEEKERYNEAYRDKLQKQKRDEKYREDKLVMGVLPSDLGLEYAERQGYVPKGTVKTTNESYNRILDNIRSIDNTFNPYEKQDMISELYKSTDWRNLQTERQNKLSDRIDTNYRNHVDTQVVNGNIMNTKQWSRIDPQNARGDANRVKEIGTIINLMTKANYKIAELPPGQYKNELTKLLGDQATPDQLREKQRSLTDERDALYKKYSYGTREEYDDKKNLPPAGDIGAGGFGPFRDDYVFDPNFDVNNATTEDLANIEKDINSKLDIIEDKATPSDPPEVDSSDSPELVSGDTTPQLDMSRQGIARVSIDGKPAIVDYGSSKKLPTGENAYLVEFEDGESSFYPSSSLPKNLRFEEEAPDAKLPIPPVIPTAKADQKTKIKDADIEAGDPNEFKGVSDVDKNSVGITYEDALGKKTHKNIESITNEISNHLKIIDKVKPLYHKESDVYNKRRFLKSISDRQTKIASLIKPYVSSQSGNFKDKKFNKSFYNRLSRKLNTSEDKLKNMILSNLQYSLL